MFKDFSHQSPIVIFLEILIFHEEKLYNFRL